MIQHSNKKIGQLALRLTFSEEQREVTNHLGQLGWSYCQGKVGSMELQKIVAAIETASKRNAVVNGDLYREMHALYHAIIESMQGVTRGQVELKDLLRTVGLRFAVVRGTPYDDKAEGEWIAVALYGTIGAPVRGLEHETMGLGINHI
ncbi:hut operon transcriptional regulator HutP [Bacillus carboniphilus]|uniref:Hut operon positive regulatory protein n=1 Tax=Bacillus carboniphilus TaxID=86663 RepID=A0ABY9JXT7_9BACI|nr:hut operon transcriptional regulator HutP [Bacillus carboniphilus]WLR42466.1 hut operon transcriptional regulator HutP [Bacillus carboniphilus]